METLEDEGLFDEEEEEENSALALYVVLRIDHDQFLIHYLFLVVNSPIPSEWITLVCVNWVSRRNLACRV